MRSHTLTLVFLHTLAIFGALFGAQCHERSNAVPPLAAHATDNARDAQMNDFDDTQNKTSADAPSPNPNLKPDDVVRLQLEALRRNDVPAPDAGIRTAFRFASSDNRQQTGPIERFIQLVKNPIYLPLLNHKSARRAAAIVTDSIARQRVTVTAANGEEVVYLFTLSKQKSGAEKDCWMTDGVERLTDEELREDMRRIARGNGHPAS